jgi:hypothetical protein
VMGTDEILVLCVASSLSDTADAVFSAKPVSVATRSEA